MTRHPRRDGERGFTLVELLVAITILGIIMGAIGAMVATAFRTSSTVSDELNASRGPKLVSRYWTPDVENAQEVQPDAGGCGSGSPVVSFLILSVADPGGQAEPPLPAPSGSDTTVTWAVVHNGDRTQLRRFVCGSVNDASTVVPDLAGTPTVEESGTGTGRWIIRVTVPDRSQDSKQFEFDVSGTQQVTTEPAP